MDREPNSVLRDLTDLRDRADAHERDGLWFIGLDPDPDRPRPIKPHQPIDLGTLVLEALGDGQMFGGELIAAVEIRARGISRGAIALKIGKLCEEGELLTSGGLLRRHPAEVEPPSDAAVEGRETTPSTDGQGAGAPAAVQPRPDPAPVEPAGAAPASVGHRPPSGAIGRLLPAPEPQRNATWVHSLPVTRWRPSICSIPRQTRSRLLGPCRRWWSPVPWVDRRLLNCPMTRSQARCLRTRSSRSVPLQISGGQREVVSRRPTPSRRGHRGPSGGPVRIPPEVVEARIGTAAAELVPCSISALAKRARCTTTRVREVAKRLRLELRTAGTSRPGLPPRRGAPR